MKTTRPRLTEVASKEARHELLTEAKEFVRTATLAEVFFLHSVLVNWDGMRQPGTAAELELTIVAAFQWGIDREARSCLLVPEEHVAAVRRYLGQLLRGNVISLSDDATAAPPPSADPIPDDVRLPKSIRISPEERAQVARLIRLIREQSWVAELVRQILKMEAEATHQLTIPNIRAMLKDFEVLEGLAHCAKRFGARWSDHPVLRAIREEWPDIAEYKDEGRVRQLVDSAHAKASEGRA